MARILSGLWVEHGNDPETMRTGNLEIERAVAEAAASRYKAMMQVDGQSLQELLHEDLVFVHSSGGVEEKAACIATVERQAVAYKKCDLLESKVLLSSAQVVVLHGRVAYEVRIGEDEFAFQAFATDVWVRDPDGVWRMLCTHNTRVPAAQPASTTQCGTPETDMA